MTVPHRERGASMPETAIVMSVLLLLLFGIVEFGRMFYTYSFVATLAREGARWMIVRGSLSCTATPVSPCDVTTSSALQTYLRSLNEGATNPNSITTTVGFPTCTTSSNHGVNGPGCVVAVTVSYPFTFIAPFVSKATINMTSESQMVISQ